MIQAAGFSDVGCKRETNEDRILVKLDNLLFVVADGMGGQECGEIAAELATSALDDYFRSPGSSLKHNAAADLNADLQPTQERMAAAISLANERVYLQAMNSENCRGMGCTVSALNINGNMATVGNVGDSRVYLFRAGELVQLTRDDSVIAKLVASGAIRPEEASSHTMRNLLTQSVGTKETVEVQIVEFTVGGGDRLLLSSDGLHGIVDAATIQNLISSIEAPETIAGRLIGAAKLRGAPDNVSCIVVYVV